MPFTFYEGMDCSPAAEKMAVRLECSFVYVMLHYRHGSPFNSLIYALKYGNRYDIGEMLGRMAAERLVTADAYGRFGAECVIPVPVHPLRRISRGYNQAQVLAESLAARLGIPCVPDVLRKSRFRKSQTGKSVGERAANVTGTFRARKGLKYRKVILLDDVLTTGSTVEACCEALWGRYPALEISIVCMAFVE